MKLQLLRNATQVLFVNGKTILIDPMLAPKESYEPFTGTANTLRNPLVDLPISDSVLNELISQIDLVLLTHIHSDHWDAVAQRLLPKDVTIFCQPENVEAIQSAEFTNVRAIENDLTWNEIRITRTSGKHGTGEIGEKMGVVSGYFIQYENEDVYIAGDTIWCDDVKKAIDLHNPQRIVVNGGAAKFQVGDPIVMDTNDVMELCSYAPNATVYVVHLEAVNHATESRAQIRSFLAAKGLAERCFVPEDGDYLF